MNVLLVDDEYISNFINKKLIENIDAAIHTIAFNDAVEAFGKLHFIKPDLILLDINMPMMNGWDFLDKMQVDATDYKVVILTSSVNAMDRTKAAKYKNVIGFMEKPATISSLTPYITLLSAVVA
ncbi:response regulator [Ilyomonas limi]|uniref:Response regulator n=1 Tax=Ilyomonas limi TaxID=2575867 RepID=A0A4U3KZ90_9BACT|nr:response regulator [Ilyomonas limi]TKK67762.1 response regulator [Ilyomonas limi]